MCFSSFLECFRAAVPSGASTGIHEALELRDQDAKAYMGKGEDVLLESMGLVNDPLFRCIKSYSECE